MQTVIQEPKYGNAFAGNGFGEFVLSFATTADNMPTWAPNPKMRDKMLRQLIAKESYFAGALFTTISRYAAFGWSLEGPPRTRTQIRRQLHGIEHGKGPIAFFSKLLLDSFTQDNGAFYEIVRQEDKPTSPFVTMNVLDSARCYRTGKEEQPVDYVDFYGNVHKMKWYQVQDIIDMPSSVEEARGAGYCALTRMLMCFQIMRDSEIFQSEKISGRRHHQIHIVNGISRDAISDAMKQHGALADMERLTHYIEPLVVATVDPTSSVSGFSIDMAGLPSSWDEETKLKWYIALIALSFGGDYQDYAPLPGGNLGTAQQSEVLHLKSRGKGPALFMSTIEQQWNFHGILPGNVAFSFGEQDTQAEAAQADVNKRRAETLSILVLANIITASMARQILLDTGYLDPEILAMIGEADATTRATINSSVPAVND